MYDNYCWDLIFFIIGILVLSCIMLCGGYFLGGRSNSQNKSVPFESGIKSVGTSRMKFSIKFYLIAMIFLIFDIESIYIYIWSISIRGIGWLGFIEILIFVFVLLVSLIYSIRMGIFDWVMQSKNRYIQCKKRTDY